MMWNASQRYGECLRKCISAPFIGTYFLSARYKSVRADVARRENESAHIA